MRKHALKVMAVAGGLALAGTAVTAKADITPVTMGPIVLPVDPATIATAVATVGGTLLVIVLGISIAFRLVRRGANRMSRSV